MQLAELSVVQQSLCDLERKHVKMTLAVFTSQTLHRLDLNMLAQPYLLPRMRESCMILS